MIFDYFLIFRCLQSTVFQLCFGCRGGRGIWKMSDRVSELNELMKIEQSDTIEQSFISG